MTSTNTRGAKVLALRRSFEELAAELDEIAASSAQHASNGAECMDALHASAEMLMANLDKEDFKDRGSVDDPLARRRAQLEEEVLTLERRAAAYKAGAVLNGSTWAASVAKREEELELSLRNAEAAAEASQAAAAIQSQEAVQKAEAYLAELHESRREAVAGRSMASGEWRARFESFIVAQNVSADSAAYDAEWQGSLSSAVEPGANKLDQVVTAALQASGRSNTNVQEAGSTAAVAGSWEATALTAAQCVAGMAEAERRRRGLLVATWRQLHGCEDTLISATSGGKKSMGDVPVVDQVFTPRQTARWDLDMSSIATKTGTPGIMGYSGMDGLRRF